MQLSATGVFIVDFGSSNPPKEVMEVGRKESSRLPFIDSTLERPLESYIIKYINEEDSRLTFGGHLIPTSYVRCNDVNLFNVILL